MNQHLIAIDLDGTTLNNQSELSPLTIQTLRLLSEMGHMVSIVTGRPYRNSIHFFQQLNIQAPMVNFNGAYCHFPNQPAWAATYHKSLDRKIALSLFDHQDELGIDLLCAEGIEKLYTSSMKLPESPFYPADSYELVKLSRQNLTIDPTALTIFCPTESQETIKERILTNYGDCVSVRVWGGELPVLEVTQAGIHKATAVKVIADFYHIPQENILAFGDEENDIEMLAYAGHGVAMKNCNPTLLEVTDKQTSLTNDQDGLAHYLIDFFNLKNYLSAFEF